ITGIRGFEVTNRVFQCPPSPSPSPSPSPVVDSSLLSSARSSLAALGVQLASTADTQTMRLHRWSIAHRSSALLQQSEPASNRSVDVAGQPVFVRKLAQLGAIEQA